MAPPLGDLHPEQPRLRASGEIARDLHDVFSEEAESHLRCIYDGLDRLCADRSDIIALGDVRSSAHTLRDAAGSVGHEDISGVTQRVEDLLDLLIDRRQPLESAQLEILLIATDLIQELSQGQFEPAEMAQHLRDISQRFESMLQSVAACPVSDSSPDLCETRFQNAAETVSGTAGALTEAAPEMPSGDQHNRHLAAVRDQLTSNRIISNELQAIFSDEAEELLAAIYLSLERLKQNLADQSAISEIRRSSHTLKGAAAAVGLTAITRLAHRLEDLLDVLCERRNPVTIGHLQLMLVTADRIHDLTDAEFAIDDMATAIADIYLQYDREMEAFGHSANANPAVSNGSSQGGHGPQSSGDPDVRKGSASTSDAIATAQMSDDADEANDGASAPRHDMMRKKSENKAASASGQYLRVPLERIDSLVALVGEMVVNRSAVNQRLSDFEARIQDMQLAVNRFRAVSQDLEASFAAATKLVGGQDHQSHYGSAGLSAGSSTLHDHPAAAGLNRENPGTRDLDSLEFDRYTEVHLRARSIAEATNDIAVITNELRNIHGDVDALIERQQRFNRDAQGGLIQIRMLPLSSIVSRLERTVRTVSNKLGKNVDLLVLGEHTELDKTVLEEITDPLLHLIRNALDHGIESSHQRTAAGKSPNARLTVEALNQGMQVTLRVSDDGRGLDLNRIRQRAIELGLISGDAELTNEELHSLIFLPGFSTADSLSDVSGRGVGMDVVRDAVQRLKGTIRVESTTGKGTTFTIHLPTSLSVTRALIVVSSAHLFAIPMQSVLQILRMDMVTTSEIGTQTFINRNGNLLRLTDLAQHLELRNTPLSDSAAASRPVLLIRSGDNEIAVTADSVKGGQDIVVKTLGDHLRHVPGYLGATFTGDGTVIPILDPSDLCGEKSRQRTTQIHRPAEVRTKRRRTAMVIDDSLSVRRVATNLLRSHGWDVVDAKDGLDALEKLGAMDVPPEVFLCDMEMPRMDGLELIERLRGMSEFSTTPIVMVTSRSSEKHRRLAAEAGADEHVVKPFKDDQLMSLIERMVSEHRELVRV